MDKMHTPTAAELGRAASVRSAAWEAFCALPECDLDGLDARRLSWLFGECDAFIKLAAERGVVRRPFNLTAHKAALALIGQEAA